MNTLLSLAALAMNAEFSGQDNIITGVTADSRKIIPGDLFFAIKGERVDGHDYIQEAKNKGAVGVVVSSAVDTTLSTLRVSDTVQALGQLAKVFRKQFKLPMIAITGSCGKTTVKEMLVSILSLDGPLLSNQGNLNTEVGLPLTLLRLQEDHKMAVIEMGARQKGDIAYLMDIASPNVSLITNAGIAHLEIFGSKRGIAETKGEIYSGLCPTGTAAINLDDENADYWKELLKPKQTLITFGLNPKAMITAKYLTLEPMLSEFDCVTDLGTISLRLCAPGLHNVQNALAAVAGARALGVSLETIKRGLEQFLPVKGRLQFKKGPMGVDLIDDTYNANPISVQAALTVLGKLPGQKIFLMGDMFELGKDELLLHKQVGEQAKQLGVDKLLGVGTMTQQAVKGFGEGAKHYPNKDSLIAAVHELLKASKTQDKTTVLIKGSRGMRMEEIVLALTTD